MNKFYDPFCRDERGTSVVEMGLVAPLLASFLIGLVDISRGYSEKLQLEQAAQRAIEKVMQKQTTTSTYASLQAEAAYAAGVSAQEVDVEYWLECNGVKQATYEMNCPVGQAYARFITVTVQKDFVPLFGTGYFPGANSDGSFTLTAEAGIRTQ